MEATEDNNCRKKYKSTAVIDSDEEDNENVQLNPEAAPTASTATATASHNTQLEQPQPSNVSNGAVGLHNPADNKDA